MLLFLSVVYMGKQAADVHNGQVAADLLGAFHARPAPGNPDARLL